MQHIYKIILVPICAYLSVVRVLAVGVQYSVTIDVLPNAPSDLSAFTNSPTQVQLNWMDNSNNEDGFVIERKVASSSYSTLAVLGSNVATYTDNSVVPDTNYSYRVAAYLGSTFSAFSNEATTTTPSVPQPPPPSSGGGGGLVYTPISAYAVFRGVAYPNAQVEVAKDGILAGTTQAAANGVFEISLSGLSGGNYNFNLSAKDRNGLRSATYSLQISVVAGATTVVNGLYLPPTLFSDKVVVKKEDTIQFSGYTAPFADVVMKLYDADKFSIDIKSKADTLGYWFATYTTANLATTTYSVRSQSQISGTITPNSSILEITVGKQSVLRSLANSCPAKGDLNKDCRVNLIDFSILAYWYHRVDLPSAYDLNGDKNLTLADFSILSYYWTG